jgi:hypothetical protein
VIQVTYIINDNVLTTYYPIETWKSGKHILNLYYPLSGLTANTYNTFRVWLKMTGGSASVGRAQAIATISGQGLSANKVWDGRLEFSDTAALVRFSGLKSVGYTAAVSTELITPTPAAFLDSLPLFRAGGLSISGLYRYGKGRSGRRDRNHQRGGQEENGLLRSLCESHGQVRTADGLCV